VASATKDEKLKESLHPKENSTHKEKLKESNNMDEEEKVPQL
jgi:hypothetical protein